MHATDSRPVLPGLVRRWAVDNIINRHIELRHMHWSDVEAFPPGQIRQLRLTDDDGFYDAVREIPELDLVWNYAGRLRNRPPLDVTIVCKFHPWQLGVLDGPMAAKVERHLVSLRRHGFIIPGRGDAWYWIGQCKACRAVYWGDEGA